MNIFSRKIFELGFFRITFALSTLLYYSFASKNLTQEDYSALRNISIYVEIFPAIIIFGLSSTIPRFVAQNYSVISILRKSITFQVIFSATILAISLYFLQIGALPANIFIWLISLTTALVQIFTALVISSDGTRQLARSSFYLTIVFIISCGYSYYDSVGVNYFLMVRLFYSASLLIWPLYFLKTAYKNEKNEKNLNYKTLIFSSIHFGVASIISIFSINIDKIVVKYFSTNIEFATYTTGAFELPLVGLVTGAISSVMLSEMCKDIEKNNIKSAVENFKKITQLTIPIIIPAFFLIYINSEAAINLVFGSQYILSSVVFDAYLFLLLARIIIFSPFMVALGLGEMVFYRSIIELVINFICSIIIIQIFGYLYVGYSLVFTTFLYLIPFNLYSISKKVNYRLIDLLPISKIMAAFLVFLVYYLISKTLNLNFLESGMLFAFFYSIYIYGYIKVCK